MQIWQNGNVYVIVAKVKEICSAE